MQTKRKFVQYLSLQCAKKSRTKSSPVPRWLETIGPSEPLASMKRRRPSTARRQQESTPSIPETLGAGVEPLVNEEDAFGEDDVESSVGVTDQTAGGSINVSHPEFGKELWTCGIIGLSICRDKRLISHLVDYCLFTAGFYL